MDLAGKIIPIFKGEYDPSVTYDILDTVILDDRVYSAKISGLFNITPDKDIQTHWVMLFDGAAEIEKFNQTSGAKFSEIYQALADLGVKKDSVGSHISSVDERILEIERKLEPTEFRINTETWELEYTSPNYIFAINPDTGVLEWEVIQ